MSQPQTHADIARRILDGFDDYRTHLRSITDGAKGRFEQAQWQQAQQAAAARIHLYEQKVGELVLRLQSDFSARQLLDINCWSGLKGAYIDLIDSRPDDERSRPGSTGSSATCSGMT